MTLRWRLLTPAGRPAALAAVAVEADSAAQLDAWLAQHGMPGPEGAARLRSLLGADEGLVLRPGSRQVILTPHGGTEIMRQLAQRLEATGVRQAQEVERWPEAAGETESRLLEALWRAPTALAIEVLLRHARRWDGGPPAAADGEVPPGVAQRLGRLLNPPTVAIVGAANIGKSALLNRLARRTVSVVADEPGTTRDHVGAQIDCAGLVVRMLDSPGLRAGVGAVEAEAQDLAREQIATADLLLVCHDAAAGPAPLDLPPPAGEQQRLAIATRADLTPGGPNWPADVTTSALAGTGIEALAGAIREALLPPADLAHPGRWRFWEWQLPAGG